MTRRVGLSRIQTLDLCHGAVMRNKVLLLNWTIGFNKFRIRRKSKSLITSQAGLSRSLPKVRLRCETPPSNFKFNNYNNYNISINDKWRQEDTFAEWAAEMVATMNITRVGTPKTTVAITPTSSAKSHDFQYQL